MTAPPHGRRPMGGRLRRRLRDNGVAALLLAAAALFVAAGALGGGRFEQQLIAMSGVWALIVIGYQWSFGHAGALNLAQGAFFGVGAYVSAVLALRYGFDFALTLPLAVAGAAALAAVAALPVLRLGSHYFALATLALAQLVHLVAVNWQALTGGANGLAGVPGLRAFGVAVPAGVPQIALVWGIVAIAAAATAWLMSGRTGLVYTSVRETPLAAASCGINAGRYRFASLVGGAGLAGAAGALQVHILKVVSPEVTHFAVLVTVLTMTVLGGRRSVAGGIVAALLLTHLPEWVRGFESYYLAFNGAVLLAAVVFAPAGLFGLALTLAGTGTRTAAATPVPPAAGGEPLAPRAVAGTRPVHLRATALSKTFGGVRALDDVDVELRPAAIVGVIGPNGSGKTTLVNVVSGLVPAQAGTVRIGDHDVTGWPVHRIARLGLARTFQTPDLPGELSVVDAVAAVAGTATAMRALAAVGDRGDGRERCADLAHGRRRLVELARAVATGAPFLLLDEPAAGLSADEAERLAAALRRLAAGGRGLMVVDHHLEFLMPLCDRVICLDRGRVIAAGTPDEVAADDAVRAAYFGAAS